LQSLENGSIFFKSRRSILLKEKVVKVLFEVREYEVDEFSLSVSSEKLYNISVFDAS